GTFEDQPRVLLRDGGNPRRHLIGVRRHHLERHRGRLTERAVDRCHRRAACARRIVIRPFMIRRMGKERLEAFSDGVIAILITIMILELKVPSGSDWQALRTMVPSVLTYVLSFVYLGIYWNNHHHMLHAARTINGKILWANLHLLFWLSIIPFVTGWMGENHFAPLPTAVYGGVLLLSAV